MAPEMPFRIALLVLAVASAGITLVRRLQAAATGEKISHREEGYAFALVLRLTGILVFLTAGAYIISPEIVQWAALPLPVWLRWCGAVIGAMSTLFLYWTLACLGKNLTDTVVTRAGATLVRRGPYRWVRHPFYVATAGLMLAAMLLSANALIGGGSLAALGLLALRTPKEEQMLLARFGDDYRAYMTATGRYFPRFHR